MLSDVSIQYEWWTCQSLKLTQISTEEHTLHYLGLITLNWSKPSIAFANNPNRCFSFQIFNDLFILLFLFFLLRANGCNLGCNFIVEKRWCWTFVYTFENRIIIADEMIHFLNENYSSRPFWWSESLMLSSTHHLKLTDCFLNTMKRQKQ